MESTFEPCITSVISVASLDKCVKFYDDCDEKIRLTDEVIKRFKNLNLSDDFVSREHSYATKENNRNPISDRADSDGYMKSLTKLLSARVVLERLPDSIIRKSSKFTLRFERIGEDVDCQDYKGTIETKTISNYCQNCELFFTTDECNSCNENSVVAGGIRRATTAKFDLSFYKVTTKSLSEPICVETSGKKRRRRASACEACKLKFACVASFNSHKVYCEQLRSAKIGDDAAVDASSPNNVAVISLRRAWNKNTINAALNLHCPTCASTIARPAIESSERPKRCETCGNDATLYQCVGCGECFATYRSAHSHLSCNNCLPMNYYRCRLCNFSSTFAQSARRHLVAVHDVDEADFPVKRRTKRTSYSYRGHRSWDHAYARKIRQERKGLSLTEEELHEKGTSASCSDSSLKPDEICSNIESKNIDRKSDYRHKCIRCSKAFATSRLRHKHETFCGARARCFSA